MPRLQIMDAPDPHGGLSAMLHDRLIMRGWVHVSSECIIHGLLRAGQALELRATPIEKWEKNRRRFLKLHVAVVGGGQTLVEEIRTALIREDRD